MAAYDLRGAEPAEPDDVQRGYMLRGKQIEDYVFDRFAERYGRDNLVRHKPIPWPAGIAHGDIFVKPEKLAVEAKSTSSLVPLHHHVLQLAGQVIFDPDAEQGLLVLVNPSNLVMRPLPMPVVPVELEEEVRAIADTVAGAANPRAELPERVCSKPSDAFSLQCPHAGTCFADWTPPDPIELDGDIATLAGELYAIEQELKTAKERVAEVEENRNLKRDELRRTIEPAREYVSPLDELSVRITPIAGRVTWDIKTAIELGAVDATVLEPFRKEGKPSERWTVKPRPEELEEQSPARVLAGLTPDDFGEEAPF
jgi:hypothetical protein